MFLEPMGFGIPCPPCPSPQALPRLCQAFAKALPSRGKRFPKPWPSLPSLASQPASQPASHGRGVGPRDTMYYVGEHAADKSSGRWDVRGADNAHKTLHVQIWSALSRQQADQDGPPPSQTARDQAKKALSTGSGPGVDWSTCIRFSRGCGCAWLVARCGRMRIMWPSLCLCQSGRAHGERSPHRPARCSGTCRRYPSRRASGTSTPRRGVRRQRTTSRRRRKGSRPLPPLPRCRAKRCRAKRWNRPCSRLHYRRGHRRRCTCHRGPCCPH